MRRSSKPAESAREVISRLIADADVLIVKFFDDQLVRFQLDYESVRALNGSSR
jgi:crotonobetainyl-CoA:carnitine CoA-transferase CaiB-like acyl-CoA transferase